jgi:hypothetical protein
VIFHAYHGHAFFTLWDASGARLTYGDYFYSQDGSDTAWFTMPVAKGEHFQWKKGGNDSAGNTAYLWRSIGKNAGAPTEYNP